MKNNVLTDNRTATIKLFIILSVLLPVTIVFATGFGAVGIPFEGTVRIILSKWGVIEAKDIDEGFIAIIYHVRFPRVLVAALVGAALSVSGAVMQGMFRNPMADPGILGVSSGAGLGAVIAVSTGLVSAGIFYLPVLAVVGASASAFLIYRLSVRGGKIPVMNLLLSGIAVSMFLGAVTTLILSWSSSDRVKQFLFWTSGSLNDSRWEDLYISFVPILVCTLLLFMFSRDLNVLLLGEEEAHSVGLDPVRARKYLLALSSANAAFAVCICGGISFVGLIVPHIIRLIAGPDHKKLLPASALGGAVFLVACDLLSRLLSNTFSIGVGIITSMIGAPYFLYLLYRNRKEGGAF